MSAPLTRRAALAGALATVPAIAAAAVPALAMSEPLARALAAHKAALAIVEATPSSPDDDAFEEVVDIEDKALRELADTPCANDAEFLVKLAYLIEHERHNLGAGYPYEDYPYGSVVAAAALHLGMRE